MTILMFSVKALKNRTEQNIFYFAGIVTQFATQKTQQAGCQKNPEVQQCWRPQKQQLAKINTY